MMTLRLATNIINIITPCSVFISSEICHMKPLLWKNVARISKIHGIPITKNNLMLIINLSEKIEKSIKKKKKINHFSCNIIFKKKCYAHFSIIIELQQYLRLNNIIKRSVREYSNIILKFYRSTKNAVKYSYMYFYLCDYY